MSASGASSGTDGRTQRAERRRRQRRAEIVEAATRRIARQGYVNTSVADVIDEAGVSRGTFYLYFDSRDGLFEEIVDSFASALESAIEVVTLEDEAPAEKFYENFRRVVELLAGNRDLTKVLFREAIGQSAAVDARVNAFYDFLQRMVTGALRKGAIRGITRPVDDAILAPAVIGSVKEVLYAQLVVADGPVDPARIATALFEFWMVGLRA